jgi:hypothetical protein
MESKVPTLAEPSPRHAVVLGGVERCMHRKPVAFVPFIIRWGPDASSDMLRRSAHCTKCGRKGAALQHPSWAGMHVGFEPFPSS